MKVFRPFCYAHISNEKLKKLGVKSKKRILVGCHNIGDYKLFDLILNRFMISMDVMIDEFTS